MEINFEKQPEYKILFKGNLEVNHITNGSHIRQTNQFRVNTFVFRRNTAMSRSDYGTPFFQRRPARTACHRSQIAIGYTSRFLDAFGIYTRQNMPIPGELKNTVERKTSPRYTGISPKCFNLVQQRR
ncbi:hypothetical protein [Odoribacter splanchnicus]|uniref:hypothetical protein n=1 Tax=Odoribacter splanchnicus TaxID=28118 RepID=UPI0011219C08|nr:hypothetical protein [Odoribacter splanchnicus]MBQ7841977.1 hypothetical protein [Odoribacter sp.]MDB9202931.1 hypothetical protein [Odoribacter splanchnicus]